MTPHRGNVEVSIDATQVFGTDAEEYDRWRPGYPEREVHEVLRRFDVTGDAVDVGCGTGKFTAVLAGHDLRVTGVEPDPRMAALAVRRGLAVRVAAFEEWTPPLAGYDLFACAQAWHWLTPARRSAKAWSCLRPGGRLLLAWNLPLHQDHLDAVVDEVQARILEPGWDALYRAAEQAYPVDFDLFAEELAEHGFRDVEQVVLPWRTSFTAQRWARLLGTGSAYLTLVPEDRARLVEAVQERVESRFGPAVEVEYACVLLTAKGGEPGAR